MTRCGQDGSPPQRRIRHASAGGSNLERAAVLASSQSKNPASRIRSDLHGLGHAGCSVTRRQRIDELYVVHDGKGYGAKVPRKFLTPKALIPFLTPSPSVPEKEPWWGVLHPHAPVSRCSSVAHHIQYGAAPTTSDTIDCRSMLSWIEPLLQPCWKAWVIF